MKIIYDAYGQMCNRFWEYLDQIAWAKLNNSRVISLFWDPSLEDFDILRKNSYIKFPLYVKSLNRGVKGRVYRHFLYKVLHNKTIQSIFASSICKGVGFVSGKDILHVHDYYPIVWEEVRCLFAPNMMITKRIDEEFAKIRNHTNVRIVGVHIRRGDYKDYCGGRFYFPIQEYKRFMNQICELMGENIIFFISSNENIDTNNFNEFSLLKIRDTRPAEDMYGLSKCDYIIGPYSSFSSWASFYGGVPYCRLERDMTLSIDVFEIVKSFGSPLYK